MKLLKILMLLGMASTMLSGCGTLLQLAGPGDYEPYDGVQEVTSTGGLFLIDLPFSLIADTLLLPVAIF